MRFFKWNVVSRVLAVRYDVYSKHKIGFVKMIFFFNKCTRGRMGYEVPQRTCMANVQNAVNCIINNWQLD
jgi:hypothetical protein